MSYTNINKSTDYFNIKLYTGTGASSQAQTGVGFQPDFVWIKSRSSSEGHVLADVVRGATKYLISNTTSAEVTNTDTVKSFDSDGYTIGPAGVTGGNGVTFASWNWKAGGGQGSSNTDGSINTTYTSVSTTSGFSISTYTGNATAGATIGHGLGKVPEFIIFRRYQQAENWGVYHHSIGNAKSVRLNETGEEANDTTLLNSTTPTSSLITLGTSALSNVSGNPYIAYAFAPIQGFSKFGKYIGNGNATTPPFIYTGFKPALVITKISSGSTNGWTISDIKRDNAVGGNGNGIGARVLANASSTEETNNIWASIQKYSNGFSPQGTDAVTNANGSTYIYAAFAAAPLVGTNNVPANAR